MVGDPADVEGQSSRQLTLDREVEALDVWRLPVVRIAINRTRPAAHAVQRQRLERLRPTRVQGEQALLVCNSLRKVHVPETPERRLSDIQRISGEATESRVVGQEVRSSRIVHTVATTDNGVLHSRNVPAEADRRSKIV